MNQKQAIVDCLKPVLQSHLSDEAILSLIEVPKESSHGDLAFPVFQLAKVFRKAPNLIAQEIVDQVDPGAFAAVQAVGPYINFKLNRSAQSQSILQAVLEQGADYGRDDSGQGGKVPIDMSSPNIAKPMSMGHLRSTVIGNAIALILDKVGYQPIKINHLGDWGTQFGKLIVAYQLWGDEAVVKADPVNELVKLYVRFHEEADKNPELNDQGRLAFKRLEDGDPEMHALWTWFKDESIKEFNAIYDLLGIEFDSVRGEAFYNDKMEEIVDLLDQKGITEVDNGATLVKLDELDLPPALIKKSDGATLYMTRDLATAYFRKREYDFVKSLYVVGNEQSVHFKQLKAVLAKMGNDWAEAIEHIAFGLITLNGKKLSTRKGKIVLLADVLNEAIDLAQKQIEAKNPDLANAQEVARQVGVGAVMFHDLKTDRLNNFDFNLEEVVQFEGETGPYVQYAHARAHSIIRKYPAELDLSQPLVIEDDYGWEIIKKLADFSRIIHLAADRYEPSVIAKYAISLAQAFNKYYANTRVLDQDDQINARIALVQATATVLKNALALLGIEAPEEM